LHWLDAQNTVAWSLLAAQMRPCWHRYPLPHRCRQG
jgi:hypothetical protein